MPIKRAGKKITVGDYVHVNPTIPGLGNAIDRFGVVTVGYANALKYKVKLNSGEYWLTPDDLTLG